MRGATVSGVFAPSSRAHLVGLQRVHSAPRPHARRRARRARRRLPAAATQLAAAWQAHASNAFNLGGLLGAFAALPLAKRLGRRPMFIAYFLFSAIALFVTFGLELAPQTRLAMLSVVGAGVYGIFGAFTFYLPNCSRAPARHGRGLLLQHRAPPRRRPLVIGLVSAMAGGSSAALMRVLFWVALVPLAAALVAPCDRGDPRTRAARLRRTVSHPSSAVSCAQSATRPRARPAPAAMRVRAGSSTR